MAVVVANALVATPTFLPDVRIVAGAVELGVPADNHLDGVLITDASLNETILVLGNDVNNALYRVERDALPGRYKLVQLDVFTFEHVGDLIHVLQGATYANTRWRIAGTFDSSVYFVAEAEVPQSQFAQKRHQYGYIDSDFLNDTILCGVNVGKVDEFDNIVCGAVDLGLVDTDPAHFWRLGNACYGCSAALVPGFNRNPDIVVTRVLCYYNHASQPGPLRPELLMDGGIYKPTEYEGDATLRLLQIVRDIKPFPVIFELHASRGTFTIWTLLSGVFTFVQVTAAAETPHSSRALARQHHSSTTRTSIVVRPRPRRANTGVQHLASTVQFPTQVVDVLLPDLGPQSSFIGGLAQPQFAAVRQRLNTGWTFTLVPEDERLLMATRSLISDCRCCSRLCDNDYHHYPRCQRSSLQIDDIVLVPLVASDSTYQGLYRIVGIHHAVGDETCSSSVRLEWIESYAGAPGSLIVVTSRGTTTTATTTTIKQNRCSTLRLRRICESPCSSSQQQQQICNVEQVWQQQDLRQAFVQVTSSDLPSTGTGVIHATVASTPELVARLTLLPNTFSYQFNAGVEATVDGVALTPSVSTVLVKETALSLQGLFRYVVAGEQRLLIPDAALTPEVLYIVIDQGVVNGATVWAPDAVYSFVFMYI